jgi:fatty acid desaturase
MYERLPHWRWLQALFTSVSGVPHPSQAPLLAKGPKVIAVSYFVAFFALAAANALLVAAAAHAGALAAALALPLIAALVLVQSGLFRGMHNYIMHNASHGNFGPRSRAIGEAGALAAAMVPYARYKPDHLVHHASLTEEVDADQQFVRSLGFVPGNPAAASWHRLVRVLLPGPALVDYLKVRWRSNFGPDVSPWRKAAFVAFHALLPAAAAALSALTGGWAPAAAYAVAWLLPCTYGAYASLVLYALSLHRWYHKAPPGTSARAAYLAKTGARFFADPCPPRHLTGPRRWSAWLAWWARFVLVHVLVSKLFVLGCTDNQHHDAHHAAPTGTAFDFCNSAYSRHRLAAEPRFRGHCWHTWTLLGAVGANFDYMATLPREGAAGAVPADASLAM